MMILLRFIKDNMQRRGVIGGGGQDPGRNDFNWAMVVRATLHPDAPAALELSIALTEGSWTLTSPHLILS